MGISSSPKRQKQLNSNAAKKIKAPKITQTKVNTQARTDEVATFKAERPAGGSRADYIAWAATNPNMKSNAARRLAKAPRKPKAQ